MRPRPRQASARSNITEVYTPEQLQDAVLAGAVHIVVRRHLDMTKGSLIHPSDPAFAASPQDNPEHRDPAGHKALPSLLPSTLSITGKCTGPLDPALFALRGAGLWPLEPQQCVIVADRQLFTLTRPQVSGADMDTTVEAPYFWIDNLYVRLKRTWRTPLFLKLVNFSGFRSQGWLTRSVVQGDGSEHVRKTERALWVASMVTRFYAQDTHFKDIGGHTSVIDVASIARFVNCSFVNLRAALDPDAADSGHNISVIPGSILSLGRDTQAWLQGCTFSANDFPGGTLVLVHQTTAIYSDRPEGVYAASEGAVQRVQPPAVPPNSSRYLSIDNPVIVAAAKELSTQLPVPIPAAAPPKPLTPLPSQPTSPPPLAPPFPPPPPPRPPGSALTAPVPEAVPVTVDCGSARWAGVAVGVSIASAALVMLAGLLVSQCLRRRDRRRACVSGPELESSGGMPLACDTYASPSMGEVVQEEALDTLSPLGLHEAPNLRMASAAPVQTLAPPPPAQAPPAPAPPPQTSATVTPPMAPANYPGEPS